MFGSEILDVAIGMIFIFLLLSLICSAINEIIEALMNKRAAFLEQGIRELLNDKPGTGLAKDLYDHPLIAGLFRGKYKSTESTTADRNTEKSSSLPSYIPARIFALALMDIVLPAASANANGTATAVKSGTDGATTPSSVESPLVELRAAVAAIENDKVKKALLALVDAAGADAARARENIENWFNSSMDRVSGLYKRRSQIIILVLGFLVAAGLNADSLAISNVLSHDKALRNSLAASAQEYAKSDALTAVSPAPSPSPESEDAKKKRDEERDKKRAECVKNKDQSAKCKDVCLDNAGSPECKLEINFAKIQGLGLPIGWDLSNPKLVPQADFNQDKFGFSSAWLSKLFGWLITAFAISLGAPFWFDLLNKFMVVRSTVKPREKSHEEQSKE